MQMFELSLVYVGDWNIGLSSVLNKNTVNDLTLMFFSLRIFYHTETSLVKDFVMNFSDIQLAEPSMELHTNKLPPILLWNKLGSVDAVY